MTIIFSYTRLHKTAFLTFGLIFEGSELPNIHAMIENKKHWKLPLSTATVIWRTPRENLWILGMCAHDIPLKTI